MKIDLNTTHQLGDIVSNAKTGNASAMPVALATQPGADTAVARSARISASGRGDFDAAKVERVRSAIEAGTADFRLHVAGLTVYVIARKPASDLERHVGAGAP